MELILINQTKLKIMLTAPDMMHYALLPEKLEHMTCTDRETRSAFRHIFDDAEAQIGFHTSGERLLVQMFTSKCGGCEIFVTRLENNTQMPNGADNTDACCSGLSAGEEDLIRRVLESDEEISEEDSWEGGEEDMGLYGENISRSQDTAFSRETSLRRVILTVDTLDILLSVCARLRGMGYTGVSRAYIEEDRAPAKYHLYLEVPDGIFYQLPESFAFLKEYGDVSRNRNTELYLTEHSKLLCDCKAVEILGGL
ncbi:MAG: adaptor protein MecA [Clostridia bacterium]|nr:adaptor protein MecA [Clostridia bacterium]